MAKRHQRLSSSNFKTINVYYKCIFYQSSLSKLMEKAEIVPIPKASNIDHRCYLYYLKFGRKKLPINLCLTFCPTIASQQIKLEINSGIRPKQH